MKVFSGLKRVIFALLLGTGIAASLVACSVDTDWRYDSHADHADLYR